MKNRFVRRLLPTAMACALTACSQGSLPYMQGGTALRALSSTGAGKITHVVYIVQENRSFDNLFQGYPGADTVSRGKTSDGKTVPLQPVSLAAEYVIDHSADAMFAACHGTGKLPGTKCRMDGFNNEYTADTPPSLKHPEYVYVPHTESQPYFAMASEGVLADRMFQSHLDESYVSHQYIIAAQAQSSVDLPYGLWGCPGGPSDEVATINKNRTYGGTIVPCYDYQTLGDELDNARLSWRFYTSQYGSQSSGDASWWSSYQAVKHIYYGPDWLKDVIVPNWRFITDVRHGKLANFTWITPVCDDSDHVNCGGGHGPSWVAALVNAVGQSKFWNSTAIFIQWDDWGGLYDHVPPPFRDYDGNGFRVPLVMLSPYARRGRVSHVYYETTSVLRFAEDLFGLGQLAAADARATSPAADCFNFSQAPLPFIRIKAPLPPKFFMQQYGEYRAPDYE